MSDSAPSASVPDKATSSDSSHTPADTVNATVAAASNMASNARDTVVGATVTARDTVAREAKATQNDLQGLSASASQAANDADGHPLAKYHSVVYDTVTWKFPRASAIALFLIVSGILASQFVHFSRFVFRILWISFASTATIEAASKLVSGKGFVSGLKPRQYYQVNKNTFDVLFSEIANVSNFVVLEFQRLLFAEKTSHTAIAFVTSYLAYKLVRYIPLWGLTLIGTVLAFSLPQLYLQNQEVIDRHISQAQDMAAEKVTIARDMAGEKVGVVSERVQVVTSEWGKKAGVELPWSPTKAPVPSTKTPAAHATGIESLQGLNVPQATPQRRVDPLNVPLPETPAPVAL